jgi:hypothetical protein
MTWNSDKINLMSLPVDTFVINVPAVSDIEVEHCEERDV